MGTGRVRQITAPPRAPSALFIGLIGLSSGCGHRTVVAAGDAGELTDAGVLGLDAVSDVEVVPQTPVSEILFEDVHLTSGNPRKINPNVPGATEPDNVVRLYIKPLVKTPPPLAYAWSVDRGKVVSDSGSEIRFSSSSEGAAKIRCRVTNTVTGDVLVRERTITIKLATAGVAARLPALSR